MLVSAAQVAASLDKEANRDRAAAAVHSAGEAGARLLVLPEAAMCSFGPVTTDLVAAAEPLDGPFVTALAEASAGTGTTVVAGTFEPTGRPDKVYNTVVCIGPDGLVGAYRKLHLYDALGWCESDRVAAGDPADPLLTFALGDLVVGVMTCYDLRFPEMARALIDRGATVLCVPSLWVPGPAKADVWEVLLRARAIESTAYVVAADQPGPEGIGCSSIVDPSGAMLASAGGEGEAVVSAELLAERVAEVRAAMPVLAHRRFDVAPRTRATVGLTAADREAITAVVKGWQAAFDRHDWTTLAACLTPSVVVDYTALRGEGRRVQSAAQYAELRRQSLDHLEMEHRCSDLVISDGGEPGTASAVCQFEVRRFDRATDRHFDSWGTYRLGFVRDPGGAWRISAIEQQISRNEGDPGIHQGTSTTP